MARNSKIQEVLKEFSEKMNYISEVDIKKQEEFLLQMGEEPENIRIKAISLDLIRQGVIKRISIGRWRASTLLNLALLGVNPQENEEIQQFLAEYIRGGSELLLPARYVKKLGSIENSARQYLKNNSIETPWGSFVPWTINKEVNEKLASYRGNYFEVINEIVETWEAIQDEMEASYRVGAAHAWRRLNYIPPDKPCSPPKEWVDSIIKRLRDNMITKQRFLDSCYFDIITEPIPVAPSVAMAEAFKQEALQKEKAILDEYISEEEKFIRERNRKIAEMAKEAAQGVVKQLDDFMANLLGQLRQTMYETCLELLQQNQKNGKFTEHNRQRLLNMINKLRKLNFYGDEEITKMLEQLSEYEFVNLEEKEDDLKRTLTDVATLLRSDLLDLGLTPRTGREFGIPDVVTKELREQIQNRKPRRQIEFDFETPAQVPVIPLERKIRRGEQLQMAVAPGGETKEMLL